MQQQTKGFFITGIDTNVGKTQIACAFLVYFNCLKFKTVALKPIASGCFLTPQGLRNSDACLLQKYASEKLPYSKVNPIAFYEPIAPHIAAKKVNQKLQVKNIIDVCKNTLKHPADVHIIEGMGGWLVPLNAKETTADLAKAFAYPIILVVGMRLGCLNHTLLTIEHMKNHAVSLAGWIANNTQPNMSYLKDNIEILQHYIAAPLLGIVPYLEYQKPALITSYLKLSQLSLQQGL